MGALMAEPGPLMPESQHREVAKKLEPWFDAEMAVLYGRPAAYRTDSVLMGCPIWGRTFIERFATWCLPSLASPGNLRALAGSCRLVIYAPAAARSMLFKRTAWLRMAGVELMFRPIPDALLAEMAPAPDATPEQRAEKYATQFCLIGCVQNLLAHQAGRDGMGFHMLMPDHVYAKDYFTNMRRLAEVHDAIAQAGISVDLEAAAPALEEHRDAESGALVLPDRALGALAAAHMHPECLALFMNHGSIPDKLPIGPRLIWQSPEALHVYSCFNNPAWLGPDLCANAPIAFTGTMDCLLPEFVPDDQFYVPTPADGMAFVEVSPPGKPVPGRWVSGSDYCEWWWARNSFVRDYHAYFKRPTIFETSPRDADMAGRPLLAADEVRRQFVQVMDMLEASRARLLDNFTTKRFGSRFARDHLSEAAE
jgi:hypothetical protein